MCRLKTDKQYDTKWESSNRNSINVDYADAVYNLNNRLGV